MKSGAADPKRIGIMGGSYGGYMVMAGLTEYPDLFAAGADLFGVVNFETFFKHTEPWMAAISKIEYGDPDTEAELLRRLSPIHKVDRVTAPTIVLHGANDTNVPVVEAEQVVESLKKRGVPVEYVLFPDEGHGWRKTREPDPVGRRGDEVVREVSEGGRVTAPAFWKRAKSDIRSDPKPPSGSCSGLGSHRRLDLDDSQRRELVCRAGNRRFPNQ